MARPPRPAQSAAKVRAQATSRPPWAIIAAMATVVVFAAIIAVAIAQPTDDTTLWAADVTVGGALPALPTGAPDPSVGEAAPAVVGQDFTGAEVAVPVAGEPTAVVFLAHWCNHCQAEVSAIVDYAAANPLPEGTNIIGVSTLASPGRANFGPQEWLERENWPYDVLVDSRDTDVWNAFGGTGTPFFAIVDADGNITQRFAGSVDPSVVWAALAELAA